MSSPIRRVVAVATATALAAAGLGTQVASAADVINVDFSNGYAPLVQSGGPTLTTEVPGGGCAVAEVVWGVR